MASAPDNGVGGGITFQRSNRYLHFGRTVMKL
jgi:hypothetical protein